VLEAVSAINAQPTRLLSATLSLLNGLTLTATMLSDRDDCDVDACPLRLFDGNDQVGEITVREDTTRHALVAERLELVACGRRHNLAKLIDKAKALNGNGQTALLHNGSVVNLVRLGEGNVEIRGSLPAETQAYVAMLAPMIKSTRIDVQISVVERSFAWANSSLFAARSAGTLPDSKSSADMRQNRSSRTHAVVDLSALAPQSSNLFVRLARGIRSQ
jgi:hypothetical protein